MSERGEGAGGPFWAEGDMLFRISGTRDEPDRMVKVSRPFALLGRGPDADVPVPDPSVSHRHTYLHLDPRGVYAVDLVTRSGTRINGEDRPVGWLRPGDWLEVAGRRVELWRLRVGGAVVEPPPCDDDLLAEGPHAGLVGVTLEPLRSGDPPWVLGSELVFLGWSASCGIQVKDPSVARTHCALVRTDRAAYLVNLCGQQTWVEDRPVRGASAVVEGDLITIGSTQFTARVGAPERPDEHLPEVIPRPGPATLLAHYEGPAHDPFPALYAGDPSLPVFPEVVADESRNALLAWMLGTIQGGQGEVLRRQGEFQVMVTEVLRQIQQDNATLLGAHLQRIESIDREIASLRAELERRHTRPAPPAPPDVPPLRIARPSPTPDAPPDGTPASTTWLLSRVNQLEDENRSAWKDLLGRLSQSRKAT